MTGTSVPAHLRSGEPGPPDPGRLCALSPEACCSGVFLLRRLQPRGHATCSTASVFVIILRNARSLSSVFSTMPPRSLPAPPPHHTRGPSSLSPAHVWRPASRRHLPDGPVLARPAPWAQIPVSHSQRGRVQVPSGPQRLTPRRRAGRGFARSPVPGGLPGGWGRCAGAAGPCCLRMARPRDPGRPPSVELGLSLCHLLGAQNSAPGTLLSEPGPLPTRARHPEYGARPVPCDFGSPGRSVPAHGARPPLCGRGHFPALPAASLASPRRKGSMMATLRGELATESDQDVVTMTTA